MKTCTKCKSRKPFTEFHRQSRSKDGHREQCKECRVFSSAAYYKKNSARIKKNVSKYQKQHLENHRRSCQTYSARHPVKSSFFRQRAAAKKRGIEFRLTLEQFREFWGDKFWQRGKTADSLVCARYGDTGAYEIGNIYICTVSENSSGPKMKAVREGDVS